MTLLDVHSRGGTCDRCGKALVNVAVISDDAGSHSVGLDCLSKVEITDWNTKQAVRGAVKDARTLGTIKKLADKGELKTTVELNPNNEKIYYWYDTKGNKNWVGLAEQNTKGLRKEIWELVTL